MTTDRMERYTQRRKALAGLTDDQLRDRFWELCHQAVAPMLELARTHTSPSIERSVLLRMGIDSVTAKGVVTKVQEAGWLGRGAGQVVLQVAQRDKTDVRAAAARIAADRAVLAGLFGGK
jgi:D-ornithine 4,5-aminomutase subunit alpha